MAQQQLISRKRARNDSGHGSVQEYMDEDGQGSGGAGGGSSGPSGADQRFISLKSPIFRITTTRRLYNTLTEGQFFWPMYMYLTPYVMSLKFGSLYGPVNQVVDYLLSKATPIFHQATNFKTSMRLSHITSNIQTASGASEVDTVAGNNSPYLNIGRDSIGLYKSISCGATQTPSPNWSETALRTNDLYACMHNGGVYTDTNVFNGSSYDQLNEFGSQAPYSMFSEVQTLQSGAGSPYMLRNNYHAPDGHAFVVPSMKDQLGACINSTLPLANVRFPFPTTQLTSINNSNTAVGANPPNSGDSVIRTESDIANVNLNSGGEAICLWVNPLNPDKDVSATTAQKLQVSFMLEMQCDIDVKINYAPAIQTVPSAPLFTDGANTQGKTVAMPCQASPTSSIAAYWAFGDALRPAHRNHL